jgi:hypothetical protein
MNASCKLTGFAAQAIRVDGGLFSQAVCPR